MRLVPHVLVVLLMLISVRGFAADCDGPLGSTAISRLLTALARAENLAEPKTARLDALLTAWREGRAVRVVGAVDPADQAASETVMPRMFKLMFDQNPDISWAAAHAYVGIHDPQLKIPARDVLEGRGVVDPILRLALEANLLERKISFWSNVEMTQAADGKGGKLRIALEVHMTRRMPIDLVGGYPVAPRPTWLGQKPHVHLAIEFTRHGSTEITHVRPIDLGPFESEEEMNPREVQLTLPVTAADLHTLEVGMVVDSHLTNRHIFDQLMVGLVAAPVVSTTRH